MKDLEYYLNLDWTLIEGTDTGYTGELYHYIEIKELPSFVYCSATRELALENYKKLLKPHLWVMLEDSEKIYEPGEEIDEDF